MKPVAQSNKAWVQPLAHGASSSVDKERQTNTGATRRQLLTSKCRHAHPIVRKPSTPKSGISMEENLAMLCKIST